MPFMDHFLEEVVTKRNNTVNRIIYYFSWVIMIIAAVFASLTLGTLTMNFNWMSVITIVVSAGIAVYIWFFHDKLLTEYEYTFTNGSLDFAEVYNNKKRKSLGSLNVRNVEAFGKVDSESFRRYISMPGIKKMNWFLNREAELYYFYFTKESDRKIIIFEPSEEMVSYIRQYLPNGAYRE
ncbi:MAG: hypothetical protein ABS897_12125 [Eubacteriales bacterium]|jgi:hypothetical protein|nr:hypothetical protein [Clostridia bacterium]MBQ9402512.1 hypothetical protein [Clostridia bacterium]